MNQRSKEIMKILDIRGEIRTEELCNALCYSRSTIRRDLLELETLGLVTRGSGRVRAVHSSSKETSFRIRALENTEEKLLLAKAACRHIHDGDTIFMDASTTVYKMLPYMSEFNNLVVITNSIELAHDTAMRPKSNIELFLTGGYYRNDLGAVVGEYAIDFIDRFRPDLCFFSCLGIRPDGLYEASMQQAYAKENMIERAAKTVLLADSTKFSQDFKYKMCGFKQVDLLITDRQPSEQYCEELKNAECAVEIAK